MSGTRRTVTDMVMAALFLALMLDRHTGNPVHECLGVGLAAAAAFHLALNRAWFRSLGSRLRDAGRRCRTVLTLCLLCALAGAVASAVPLSRFVFAPLGIGGSLSLRELHVCCAHWALLLAGAHLGLCWERFCRAVLPGGGTVLSRRARVAAWAALLCVAAWGVQAFLSRDVWYLLRMDGAFLPWREEPLAAAAFDYAALAALPAICVRLCLSLARRGRKSPAA